jgi:hypothetical protein
VSIGFGVAIGAVEKANAAIGIALHQCKNMDISGKGSNGKHSVNLQIHEIAFLVIAASDIGFRRLAASEPSSFFS